MKEQGQSHETTCSTQPYSVLESVMLPRLPYTSVLIHRSLKELKFAMIVVLYALGLLEEFRLGTFARWKAGVQVYLH